MARKGPVHAVHEERGAKFTEFGGWSMPVEFTGIKDEHKLVRSRAGIFDVSHMGEVVVRGPDSEELMQRLTTNDVSALGEGEAQYSAVTRDDGVLLDDTVVYRLESGYMFVPNAGHDEEMLERWTSYRDEWGLEAEVVNETERLAMYAVQGPDALEAMEEAGADVGGLERFQHGRLEVTGVECMVSRTGYTGEDGYEVVAPWGYAERVWRMFLDEGVQPCGLGARDTLRLEMGFLLSGQDFHPEEQPRTPWEAGLDFVVDLDHDFVGRDALQDAGEPEEVFAGLRLLERGVPRHGYEIVKEGDSVGVVTSGTVSPSLDEPIGLGYVDAELSEPGTEVEVVIRGESKEAKISETPFLNNQS